MFELIGLNCIFTLNSVFAEILKVCGHILSLNVFIDYCSKAVFFSKIKIWKEGGRTKKQHGSTRSITVWRSILCVINLLFKNCLKHVHHSDLFIALFDLNNLSLYYACQNGVYNNWRKCENVNSKWFLICFPEGTIKQSSVLGMFTAT